MPWVIPSHQAPALGLKLWRPRWFSGLALVLGSAVPDLQFIVPMDRGYHSSHTLLGQLTFTLPLVLLLYAALTRLVLPWLMPYLPPGAPFHPCELRALVLSRDLSWPKVAVSAVVGGLTHLFLDGFTHDDASGWAVALLPMLRRPLAGVPLFHILQLVLTLVLGTAAVMTWGRIARGRLLWAWRETPPHATHATASPASRRRLALWFTGCAAAGLGCGGARGAPAGDMLELAAYGLLAFLGFALVATALAARVAAALRSRGRFNGLRSSAVAG